MSYFGISVKRILHYRWNIVFSIMASLLSTVSIIFMWQFIYRRNMEMREYMTVYAILSSLISLLYSDRYANGIGEKVYKGTFAIDLLRPVSFLGLNFSEAVGETAAELMVRGIPICLILFGNYWGLIRMIDPVYALLGILAVFLAFLFHMMLFTVIGFLAFRFYVIWPFCRLMNDTIRFFSGSFLPIALFPVWMQTPIRLLPFQYLYSFPIEVILKGRECEGMGLHFVLLIVWDLVMALIMLLVYRRSLLRCVVQGG